MPPQASRDIADIAQALRERHGCHTAILYGSFAAGDATASSDYDVAGFRAGEGTRRIAGKWRGMYADIFIYPESVLESPTPELLKMRGGVVLCEKDGAGARLLAKLDEMDASGAERLPEDEARAIRQWAWKMLERAGREDAEGNYRRAWLLYALPEDWFLLRGLRYPGPKKALARLRADSPAVYSILEAALHPRASLATIARAVETVAGPRDEESVARELGESPKGV